MMSSNEGFNGPRTTQLLETEGNMVPTATLTPMAPMVTTTPMAITESFVPMASMSTMAPIAPLAQTAIMSSNEGLSGLHTPQTLESEGTMVPPATLAPMVT